MVEVFGYLFMLGPTAAKVMQPAVLAKLVSPSSDLNFNALVSFFDQQKDMEVLFIVFLSYLPL